jgi:hypothetical protein
VLLAEEAILIGGRTWSAADFPEANRRIGPLGKSDIFLARIKPGDRHDDSSAILGGKDDEKLTGIALSGKRILITGYTESADFPTARPFQAHLRGPSDAFVFEIRDGFENLNFSTYFGGSGQDSGWGITMDSRGSPIVVGITESEDLPVTRDALQAHKRGQADSFLMKLDRSGQMLLLSTYYGGSGLDHAGYDGANVAVSRTGTIWMAGLTNSRDLSVPRGNFPRYGGGEQDGFLVAFSGSGQLCYLLEGVALAEDGNAVYAVGTVIRPVNKDSPRPDPEEQYGTFVIRLSPKRICN